ncbi:MAG TPA: hypothetical protein DEA08_27620, partial [Planctomycetes bacterium]|nr:hypothetical protein [Planctomycetota bacterium]
PDNVLFDERGTPLLADFGVARLDDATRLTRTADVTGTPVYMAPEVAHGAAEAASDVYSLAALVYECLSGRPPIEAQGSVLATLDAISHQEPAPLREQLAEVPPWLDRLCLRALAKDPRQRPSAAAFAEALDQGAEHEARSLALPLSLALLLLLAGGLALAGALKARAARARPAPSLAAAPTLAPSPQPSASAAPHQTPARPAPYLDLPANVVAFARTQGDAAAYGGEVERARASLAKGREEERTRLLLSGRALTPAEHEVLWRAFCDLRRGITAPNLWLVLCDHLTRQHWEPIPYLGQILVMVSSGKNPVGHYLLEEAALRGHPHALTRLGEPGIGPLAEGYRRAAPSEKPRAWLALLEALRPDSARSSAWRAARELVRQGSLVEALARYRELFAASRGERSAPQLALELSQVARFRWGIELGSPTPFDDDESRRRDARARLAAWRLELETFLEELVCVEGYYQLSMLHERVAETWPPSASRERRAALEKGIAVVEAGLERFPEQHGLLLRAANLHKLAARAAPAQRVPHLRASLRLAERSLLQRHSPRWEEFRNHRQRDLENLAKEER